MSNVLPVPAPATVRTAYHEELNEGQRSALLSWLAFTGTFALTRGVTYSIRAGRGPFRNLSAGGEHLHHYLWGIGMLAGIGAIAVRGEDRHRRHPAVAVSYGAALALIVDEFALLLDLKDVYWARQGRISVRPGRGRLGAGRDLPRGAAGAAAAGPRPGGTAVGRPAEKRGLLPRCPAPPPGETRGRRAGFRTGPGATGGRSRPLPRLRRGGAVRGQR